LYPLLRAKAVRVLRDVWRMETHLTAHDGDDVVVDHNEVKEYPRDLNGGGRTDRWQSGRQFRQSGRPLQMGRAGPVVLRAGVVSSHPPGGGLQSVLTIQSTKSAS
jgi:hypothetical protein